MAKIMSWEDFVKIAPSKEALCAVLLKAVVLDAGGSIELSDAYIRDLQEHPQELTVQTYTDRNHVRIHFPGKSELEEGGNVKV